MSLRVTSANILAPIFKRLDSNGTRESSFEDKYLARHTQIIDNLVGETVGKWKGGKDAHVLPDVLCVQEFWVQGPLFRQLYTRRLCEERGYKLVEVERTNQRGDGVACFVSPRVELVDSRPILFLDCGDRVGLLCRVRVKDEEGGREGEEEEQCDVLVVNTHLLFPHNPYSSRIRLREVQKILGFIDKYKHDEELGPLPIVFVGDLNGSPKGQVAEYLRHKGFVSAFEAYNRPRAPHKIKQWISHFSHRKEFVGVDYIFHLQPQNQSLPLAADWRKLVFSEIHKELPSAVRAAFKVFDSDDNKFIDPVEFKKTLQNLGFTGEGRPALTDEEIEFLFSSTDKDANQMIDFKEFVDRFWELDLYQKEDGNFVPYILNNQDGTPEIEAGASSFAPYPRREEDFFFYRKSTPLDNVRTMKVIDAFIEPREMEEGHWPDDFHLSDHGFLTAQYLLKG